MGFTKFDKGKPRFDYMATFTRELGGVNDILKFGAEVKGYGRDNWKEGAAVEDVARNKDAAVRHAFASIAGERLDPESKLPHLAHAICDLLFAYWHENNSANSEGGVDGI